MIAQGTTPYLQLKIRGHDLSVAKNIVISIRSQMKKMDLGKDRITVNVETEPAVRSVLTVHLTQQETLGLMPGVAKVQARWRTDRGTYDTVVKPLEVTGCLYKVVI